MMQITEDTPPDMLAGAMDLTIHLPNGRTVKMSVERSTPMMDLLVQITTANQLQHSGHILQALEMAPSSGKADKILPYKPNTPIGALDTQHVKVVPKNRPIPAPRHASTGHQPFESTFRLQVHLPRNQLYVIRVSQHVLLEDIMKKVCDEKNLDTRKYEFRHPGNLNEVLDPKLTLSDYQITEVYIVSKGTVGLTQAFSSNDIMVLKKEEERKQMQARTGGGVFSLIFKRKQGTGSGSLSSENRSISPSHSDESRSVTPPAIQQQIVIQPAIPEKPKAPQRKRRPAPKPPQQPNVDNRSSQVSTTSETNNSDLQTKNENGLTICHSRNSSDSSGYHEPSVLSENINLSLPRRPKSSSIETVREETAVDNKPSGNLSKMAVFSKSTTSITSRKKKTAPPPPPIISSEKIPEKASPVVASPIVEVQGECTTSVFEEHSYQNVEELRVTNDVNTIVEELGKPDVDNETKNSISQLKESPRESVKHRKESASSSTPPLQSTYVQEDQVDSSFLERQNSLTTPNNTQIIIEETSGPISSIMEYKSSNPSEFEEQKQNVTEDIPELENWQYQLPSPPTAFRDLTPTNLTEVTNYDTVTLEGFKQESIITNPMLYEKLELIKDFETDTLSDLISNISEDDKPMLNKLTLENLEKRKSLVYNRELSTSLKVAENDTATKRSDVINEIEEVIHGTKIWSRQNSATTTDLTPTLEKQIPNFKISTYDKPRTKINIFEDVTIRSNVERSNFPPEATDGSVEVQHNILQKNKSSDSISSEDSFKKPQEYSKYKVFSKNIFAKHTFNSVNRSESFGPNNSKPQNPVQRSRSQVALNNYKNEKTVENEAGTLSKSNSLFDVSGLHSLEVMRKIQTTLNTPNNSMEHLLEDNLPVENGDKHVEEKESTNSREDSVTKTYKYQGPPAINLSTWSERPKTKVSLKEDTDYRSNEINSNNCNDNKVSFRVNGTESVERQESGNVIIKISDTNYRKPFTSINKIEVGGRPHSIAIPNDSDISRVPIVRAVELKKPFKDNIQKSVTQINASNDVELTNNVRNKLKDWQTNVDFTKPLDGLGQLQSSNEEAKTDRFKRIVQRVNSINRFAPTVVGFRSAEFGNDNTPRSRKSWNVPSSYGTLPPKINIETTEKSNNYAPNNNVPFSRAILRRVEIKKSSNDDSKIEPSENGVFRNNPVGNKISNYNRYSTGYLHSNESFRQSSVESELISVPNPPPAPKVIIKKKPPVSIKTFEVVADPRNDLLNSIRSFGGVKGLKRVKV